MEQEIASQVVGLGGSTDFSYGTFSQSRFCCKICYNSFDSKLNFFMGFNFHKYQLFKRINASTEDFEKILESKISRKF